MTRYGPLTGVRSPERPPVTYRPGLKLKAMRLRPARRIIVVPSAPIDAQYLTLAANGELTDYRVFQVGSMLVAVDGGPTGNFTLDVDPTQIDHADLDNLTAGNPHTQYLQGTILSANGDILTRVAGSPARLPIGTNGQVLTVASNLPSWAAPSPPAGAYYSVPPVSGRYYQSPATSAAPGSLVVTANRLYLRPFPVPQTTTYDQIGLQVSALSAGNCRMGIYGPFTGSFASLPLVLDAGTFSTGTTGAKTITINQQLTPGWYILAAVFDATPTVRAPTNDTNLSPWGRTAIATGSQESSAYYAFAYAALPSPSTTTPTWADELTPALYLRAA